MNGLLLKWHRQLNRARKLGDHWSVVMLEQRIAKAS